MPKYQYANITTALILLLSVFTSRLKSRYPLFFKNNIKLYMGIRILGIILGLVVIGGAFLLYGIHVPLTTYLKGGDFASYYAGAMSIKLGNNLYRDLASFNVDIDGLRESEKYFTPETYDKKGSERLRKILEDNKIEAIGPFTYPPLNYIFFIPWTWMNWHLAFRIWVFINLTLIILSILLFTKSHDFGFKFYDFFLIGISAAMFHPLTFAQWENQINILVLFLLVSSFYGFKKKLYPLVGISLALAIHIKVFPIIMTAYFLWKREWKAFFWTLAFILMIAISICTIFDFSLLTDYITIVFPKWMGYLRPFDMNQSFNGFFSRILYSGEGFQALYKNEQLAKVLTIIFSGLVIIMTIAFCKNNMRDNKNFFDLEYGLVIVASQLCSSWVLIHHLTWYILPLMILYRYYRNNYKDNFLLPLLISLSWMLIGFRYEYGIPEYKTWFWIFMISVKFYGMILL
ncbi:DUF2029 domain-containing protein [bacterium]|nr:DUF2029 domain-containing protein [bacterium]